MQRCTYAVWYLSTKVSTACSWIFLLLTFHPCYLKRRRLLFEVKPESSVINKWPLTFEKVDCKPSFVDRCIGRKLEPELIGGALDVVRISVTTETPEQRAALRAAVPHLHIVIGAAVVPLQLQRWWTGFSLFGQFGQKHSIFPYFHPNMTRVCCCNNANESKSDFYLKWLKGEANVEVFGYCDFPHADFIGLVVIGIIWWLDLTDVTVHLSTTDGCETSEKWDKSLFPSSRRLSTRMCKTESWTQRKNER